MLNQLEQDASIPITAQLKRTNHRRRIQFLRSMVFMLLPFAIVVGSVAAYFSRGAIAADVLLMLPAAGVLALVFTLGTGRSSYGTAAAIVATTTVAIALIATPGTGHEVIYFYYFIIPVIMAATFLDIRAALMTTVVSLGIIIGFVGYFVEYEAAAAVDGPAAFLLITIPAVIFSAYFRNQMERDNRLELEQQLQNYLRLFEAAFDGFALHDGAKLVSVSPSFAALFGYAPLEMNGRPFNDFFPAANDIYDQLEAEQHDHVRLPRVLVERRDGSVLQVEMVAHNMQLVGHPLKFVAVRDISAQVQAERRQIEESVERETVGLFQRFIDAVSHDFRTPLSVLNLSIHRLRGLHTADPESTHHLGVMGQQVQRLTQMTDDMLTMIRLDRLAVMSLSWLNLNTILRTHAAEWESSAAATGRTLVLELHDDVPRVIGNEQHLLIAITKLVDNALQYSQAGSTVRIVTGHDDTHVCVEICDEGDGIAPDRLANIFDRLYRVDSSRNAQTGGSGLGLAIVKRIVSLHDGRVEVESSVGVGSTFRVVLPRPETATGSSE